MRPFPDPDVKGLNDRNQASVKGAEDIAVGSRDDIAPIFRIKLGFLAGLVVKAAFIAAAAVK